MRGTLHNSSFNLQQKLKGDLEKTENNDTQNSLMDQQGLSVFDKVDQENQITKNNVNSLPSSFKILAGDQQKNGLENKLIKDQYVIQKSNQSIVSNVSNSQKKSLKGAENYGSNLASVVNTQKEDKDNMTQNFASDFKQSVQNPINSDSDIDKSIKQTVNGVDEISLGFQDNLKSSIQQEENKNDQISDKLKSDIKQNTVINNGEQIFDIKQTQKVQGNLISKLNETLKNADNTIVKELNKGGLQDFSANQYINDIQTSQENVVNTQINESARQNVTINPFVQHLDDNPYTVQLGRIDKSTLGNVVQRNNNSQTNKGQEGQTNINQSSYSQKTPYQFPKNRQAFDPALASAFDYVLQGKQNKGVFQQQIDNNNIEQLNTNVNSNQVIQFDEEKTERYENKGKLKLIAAWTFLAIIGFWKFVFMLADVIDYKDWKFISENPEVNVAKWYTTNQGMQQVALAYSNGMSRNYISLIDFILYFFITKFFYNLWVTDDYFKSGTLKNVIMSFLFLKDVVVIILSITSGDYNSPSGWDGFGYFWLRTLGKISIIISLSKIFFFRLNYFKQFSDEKNGCSGIFHQWGVYVYSWASQNNRKPEFVISLLLFLIYLPLILHCFVGIIESTYILIIWIAVLFFLQQLFSLLFEMCQPRQQNKTIVQRMIERQRIHISDQIDNFWVYFTLLYVIIPGVASVSFGCTFQDSIQYHFTGQQIMFSYFSIPPSGSSYSSVMTFICNLLCLF